MKIRFNRFTKIVLLIVAGLGFFLSLDFGERPVHAYSSGPDPSRTGAPALGTVPAELTCNSSGCHSTFPLNDSRGTFQFLDVPSSYEPGKEYTIRLSLRMPTTPARARFGFELTVLNQDGSGTIANAGQLLVSEATRTSLIAPGDVSAPYTGRQYLIHTDQGIAPTATDTSVWTFRWKAPATRGGKITFYAAGNAANGSGAGGDYIYTTSAVMRPDIVTVNGATFSTTAPMSAGGIGSGFGVDLATSTATATDADPNTPGIQLPTTLAGTTVKVRDSAGMERNAGLFYIDANQVNYLIPDGTANGAATVTITASNGAISTGAVMIATVSPGAFTATSNGTGVAASDIQRINGGVSTYQRVFNGTAAVPIVWNNQTEEIYLNLYTTGVRGRSSLQNVSVMIGGNAQMVSSAGAQGVFAGLDQVNVLLNRNLAGRGNVNVVLMVDGQTANTVTLNFQ
jgi:uncharacterized protein (TIGR03437 family)